MSRKSQLSLWIEETSTSQWVAAAAQFLPVTKGGERQDSRDLLLELRGNGFDIVRTRAELDAVPAWRRPETGRRF